MSEPIVCEYRGRVMTRGVAPNGMPTIHFFEGETEYGLSYVPPETESAIIEVLKRDIDARNKENP